MLENGQAANTESCWLCGLFFSSFSSGSTKAAGIAGIFRFFANDISPIAVPAASQRSDEDEKSNENGESTILAGKVKTSIRKPSAISVEPRNAKPLDFTLILCARAIIPWANSCTKAITNIEIIQ